MLSHLRILRHLRHLSQQELATAAKFSQCYLSQLERGATPGSVRDIQEIARVLGVDASALRAPAIVITTSGDVRVVSS